MADGCRTCRDLRELLERERDRARVADAASLAKDRLLGVAATEWTSLVHSLLGWTQTLQRDLLGNDARAKALDIMEQRMTGHLELLGELLDVSGSEAPQVQLGAFDISELLRRVIASETPAARERAVVLSAQIPSDQVLVLADRARIELAVQRLVREVCSLTVAGGAVSATLKTEPSSVSIRVESRDVKGSLSNDSLAVVLASTTARVHAGALETSPSAATMWIPRFLPAPAAPARRERKAVVVSAETDAAQLLALALKRHGMTALLTSDEELALEACRIHAPDLLIVETEEAAARLRAKLPRPDLHVAVVSDASALAVLQPTAP